MTATGSKAAPPSSSIMTAGSRSSNGRSCAMSCWRAPMRIVIVTDAWSPQVNGVVRTLAAVSAELARRGHEVSVLSPEGRRSLPMPFYPEIRLALTPSKALGREIRKLAPDAIYIATEGPLGWAARRFCRRQDIPFTTGFHTRFADYLALRIPLPGLGAASWSILRNFHAPS